MNASLPPLDDGLGMDGLSLNQGCEKTLNGMENNKTWCKKN